MDHDPTPDHWEQHATWWQREFTDGADPEYREQILPLAAELLAGFSRVIEVGTGEGQVARVIASLGAELVAGFDPTNNQIRAAAQRGGGPVFVRGSAQHLAVRDAAVDAAVACLVFEHIDELDEAIAEVARVLRPGGRFVLFLNHPLLQTPNSGWIDDQLLDPPEQYWRIGAYLPEDSTLEEVQKGVHLRFVHRPLSRYVNALADNGLALERMLEPAPPEGFLARAPEYREAATIPRLLVLITRRRTDDPYTSRW